MMLLLAPMEGLLDFVLRDILTRAGGVDRCVSEFIRVTNTLLPDRVFMRIVPELHHQWRTPAGVPVRPQLLGSDPSCLADNAAALAALGAPGVDLNFGCPARVVNRHGGGAALLDDPEQIARIVREVRRALPPQVPLSAKMRLGLRDDSLAEACAQAMADNGAAEIVVHARTQAHGYRPPAYWERIADIRAAVGVPVVANGEIWSVADALRCRELSGCDSLMLGRGMVADPGLACALRAALAQQAGQTLGWTELRPLIADFWVLVRARLQRQQQAGRLKQWLNLLRRRHPEAQQAFDSLRTWSDPVLIDEWLAAQGAPTAAG